MTVLELKERLGSANKVSILDVRELEEIQIANIGGIHIPLGELAERFQELDPNEELVVLCHHGIRSAHAVGFLRNNGYEKVQNLSGGIDAWSTHIDPSVPRY